MFDKIEKNSESICPAILRLSLLLKIGYGILVQFNISGHDLWDVSDWSTVTIGNLGYIQYLYQFRCLPDFYIGQFYHPPLFYILSAVIMGAVYGPTKDVELAFDVIQEFNLVVAFLVSVYCYRLLKLFNVKGSRLVAGTAFFAGIPLLYNMGACINNDCLMSLLCVMTVFYVLKWEKHYDWVDIIKAALCMGLAMFTKTSAGLIAPGIALFFLYKLFNPGKERIRKKIVFQYLTFGVLSVPIGMFWLIWQHFKTGMPFDYIMPLYGKEQEAYALASASLIRRLGLPSWQQMTDVFPDYGNYNNSANIWGQFIQTTLFDEGIFNCSVIFFKVIAIALIWIFAAIMIILVLRTVSFIKDKKVQLSGKILLIGVFAVLLVSFVRFCFQYPYICTMHTRYVFCVFPIMIIAYGVSPKLFFEKSAVAVKVERAEVCMMILFGILSAVLYMVPVIV